MPAFTIDPAPQSGRSVLASGEYPLTRRDLAEIAAMIYSDAGISLNESKASLVYSRLSKHIRNLGLRDFREYCQLVSSPAGSAERREMLSLPDHQFHALLPREPSLRAFARQRCCRG